MRPKKIQKQLRILIQVNISTKIMMVDVDLSVTDLLRPIFWNRNIKRVEILLKTSLMWMNLTSLNQ